MGPWPPTPGLGRNRLWEGAEPPPWRGGKGEERARQAAVWQGTGQWGGVGMEGGAGMVTLGFGVSFL